MTVGFSKKWAVAMLTIGAAMVTLNVVIGNVIGLIPGAVCLVVGAAYAWRPYFRIDSGVVIVKAPIGPVERRYPFDSADDVKIENGKIWIKGKKLGLSKFLADNTQWDAAIAHLTTNTFD